MKIACVCIAKNEDNYIQEWIDYNLKLGFDKIVVYQNNWRTRCENKDLIKIEFDETRSDRQILAYNKFALDFNSQFDFAAFFDIDEFLVLKKHNNIKDFVKEYQEYPGISIRWVYFGDNNLKKVENNNYSVLKRFTKRSKNYDKIGKSIVKLFDKNQPPISVHYPYCTRIDIDMDVAQLNHYYCKTKEEFEIKKYNRVDDNILLDDNFALGNYNEEEDFLAYNFFNSQIFLE